MNRVDKEPHVHGVWSNNVVLSFVSGTGGSIFGLIVYAITAYASYTVIYAIISTTIFSYVLYTHSHNISEIISTTLICGGIAIPFIPIITHVITSPPPLYSTVFNNGYGIILLITQSIIIGTVLAIVGYFIRD